MEKMDSTLSAGSGRASSPQVSFRNKLVWLALFGALVGFVIKTEAAKRVTIGFEDYKLPDAQKSYNLNQIEADLLKQKALLQQKKAAADKAANNNQPPVDNSQDSSCQGDTCKP